MRTSSRNSCDKCCKVKICEMLVYLLMTKTVELLNNEKYHALMIDVIEILSHTGFRGLALNVRHVTSLENLG